jgi:hypothetical protein
LKTYLDCIPCFVRQALDAARFAGADDEQQAEILRRTAERIAVMDLSMPPPLMAHEIHGIIRDMTGVSDPYATIKQRSNVFAEALHDELKTLVEEADDPIETAARLAAGANVIDFGVSGEWKPDHYLSVLRRAAVSPLNAGEYRDFREQVEQADTILYLVDNTGEIVFDRLLIEQLPARVTVGVKSGPILNDATLQEAREAGLDRVAELMETGSSAPGTVLDQCSDAFLEVFNSADLVLAKGQANYETLSRARANLFFLLKVKCPIIGRDIAHDVGTFVLARAPEA